MVEYISLKAFVVIMTSLIAGAVVLHKNGILYLDDILEEKKK